MPLPSFPRLLPLAAVAVGGVLAVKLVMGAGSLPDILSGARAFAEGTSAANSAASATATNATSPAAIANRPAPVCAPTAAELARAAGLSPAELQVLQNLGARRTQLDGREHDIDTQMQLLAAAEARVNQRIAAMTALQGQIRGLVGQVDTARQAEIARMAAIYTAMRPRDSAPRFVLLSDEVRLPIAQAMRPRSLSAMMAQMPPAEAQRLTESLARRYGASSALAAARDAASGNPAAPATAAAPAAPGATPSPSQSAAATPPPAPSAAGGATPAPAANPQAQRPPQAARPPRPRPPAARPNRPAGAAQAPAQAGAQTPATGDRPAAASATPPATPPAAAAAQPPAQRPAPTPPAAAAAAPEAPPPAAPASTG